LGGSLSALLPTRLLKLKVPMFQFVAISAQGDQIIEILAENPGIGQMMDLAG
jgi:hypothetical protein